MKNIYKYAGIIIMLTACMLSVNAEDYGSNTGFEFDETTGTITDYLGDSSDVIIPEVIDGIPVTSIGEYAFSEKQLSSVIIPESVISIEEGAFYDNQLTSVIIPDGVAVIGVGAFCGNQLTGVTIPGSVVIIGEGAFFDNQLTSVTIPGSVAIIENEAFSYNKLTNVIILDGVMYIDSGAFMFNQLTSITIGTNVMLMGAFGNRFERAYDNNGRQEGTYILSDPKTAVWERHPRENTGISADTLEQRPTSPIFFEFDKTTGTITDYGYWFYLPKNVIIPESIGGIPVTAIGRSAFMNKGLTSIAIPDSVTSIGDGAFLANELISITIGADVEVSPSSFFDNYFFTAYNDGRKRKGMYTRPDTETYEWKWILGLKKMTVCSLNAGEHYNDNAYFEFDKAAGTIIGYKEDAPKDVIIPEAIDGIPVVSIGYAAFSESGLKSVSIPESVISIGDHAFQTNQLEHIIIPKNLTFIGDYTFFKNNLTTITIPGSVSFIGDGAFHENMNLAQIIVDEGNVSYTNDDNILFTKDKTTLIQYPLGATETSYTIPDSVTSIEAWAFAYSKLENITISDSVTSIKDRAFAYSKLESVSIPDSINTIGEYVFIYCNLTNVVIPDSIVSIGMGAFAQNNLTSVMIGNNVASIGFNAFSNNHLESVTIPDCVIFIESYVFYDNQLTSITIGADVELSSSSFDKGFYNTYNDNGKRKGTYTRPDTDTVEWEWNPGI